MGFFKRTSTGRTGTPSSQRVSHPEPKTYPKAPKGPAAMTEQPSRPLPQMLDPSNVAPYEVPRGLDLSDDICRARIAHTSTTIWSSLKGFYFDTLPFLDYNETETLVCAIGFLEESIENNATVNFVRLVTKLFNRLQQNATSYCVTFPAKGHFYGLLRMEVYNGLAGRPRRDLTKTDIGRALASLPVDIIVNIIESLTQARRDFLEMEYEQHQYRTVKTSPDRASSQAGGTHPQPALDRRTTDLSSKLNHLALKDKLLANASEPSKMEGMEGVKPPDGKVTDKVLDEILAEGQRRPKDPPANDFRFDCPYAMLENLLLAVDTWLKLLDKKEAQARNPQWAKHFSQTSTTK